MRGFERAGDGNRTRTISFEAVGTGGVVGGLLSTRRKAQTLTTVSRAAAVWAVTLLLAALAPNLLTEYLVLPVVGYGSIAFNSLAKTTLQLRAAPRMRGRVMSIWAIAWLGTTPVGGPVIGAVEQHLGARYGLLLGGVATLAVAAGVHPRLKSIDSAQAAAL